MSKRRKKTQPNNPIVDMVDGKPVPHDEEQFRTLIQPINEELVATLNDIAGTFAFGGIGLKLAREKYVPIAEDAPIKDRDLIIVHGRPGDEDVFGYQKWPLAEVPGRLAGDGLVAEQLGQQWAVLITTQWEHNFRPRLAEAAGVEIGEVREPAFADVCRIRNDIIHHHGIATKRNSGRCELLKWFNPGDRIVITDAHVSEFMRGIGAITNFPDGLEDVPLEDGPLDVTLTRTAKH